MAHADFIPSKHLPPPDFNKGYHDSRLSYQGEEPKYYTEDINEVLASIPTAKKTTKINVLFRGEYLEVAIPANAKGTPILSGAMVMALPCPPYYQEQKNEGIAGKYITDDK